MNLGIKNIWTGGGGVSPTDFETVKNRVDSLANTTAKTNIANTFTANQEITGNLKVNRNGGTITIQSGADKFLEFKRDNTREAYFGRPSSSSNDYEINVSTNNANLKFSTTGNGVFKFNNNIELATGNNAKMLDITLGYGGTPSIIPDEGVNKPLRFSKGNVRFGELDFQNQTKLANVPNIKSLTVSNIANNTSKQQNLPGNSIVLMVRRNSNGANHNNWKLLNSGALTITNDVGSTENFIVTYWEI